MFLTPETATRSASRPLTTVPAPSAALNAPASNESQTHTTQFRQYSLSRYVTFTMPIAANGWVVSNPNLHSEHSDSVLIRGGAGWVYGWSIVDHRVQWRPTAVKAKVRRSLTKRTCITSRQSTTNNLETAQVRQNGFQHLLATSNFVGAHSI